MNAPDAALDHGNGHTFAGWWKLVSVGLGAGAVLFGLLSGFWKIDARLEAQGEHLRALAESVKSLADKSATVELVEGKIEHACLRMQLANRGWSCPFVSPEKQPPQKAPAPKTATPPPPASLWPFAK